MRIVTGYIPILGHPRTVAEYGALGEAIFPHLRGDFDLHPFMETLGETWVYKLLGKDITPSIADNPAKNTLPYHIVNHQKFAWLLKSAIQDPTPETFVWMDWGIGHVPGVTPDIINNFMASIQPGDFAIPGCWDYQYAKDHANFLWPNWRFCGGLMVVPRDKVHVLFKRVKQEVKNHIARTKNITWEVNTLAQIERTLPGPLRWYYADHNEQMFTNYGVGLCNTPSLPVLAVPSDATSSPT